MASPDPTICTIGVKILFLGDARSLYDSVGPAAATSGSAGFDLVAALPEDASIIEIPPGERVIVPTGIAVEPTMPGVAGFVYSRSGLGAAKGLTVAQGVGLIDPDYRGEILVYLLNTSTILHRLRRGDRVAQLVFQPFYPPVWEVCEKLGDTERGAGGFGHTGR
ncbi:MAG: dUTP diphosphatase [Deltaproteobacteria bacterium]|nr:dUTP diphosphatase [Deltaproteobacteria bacterium]